MSPSKFKVHITMRSRNQADQISVLLQAMKEEPPLDYKCRDKFLVQSVALENHQSADHESLPGLWSNIEKTSKGSIQEKKIRVTFLPAGSATTNGVSHDSEERPPSYTATSPSPQFDSPMPAEKSGESAGAAGTAATIRNAIPTNQEDLKAQLQAAQNQIAKLTQDLKDPQVRQRKVAEAGEKVQAVVQQTQQSGGVPLQITAALCLVSFLIAYLFF
jgi:hypothetical protein